MVVVHPTTAKVIFKGEHKSSFLLTLAMMMMMMAMMMMMMKKKKKKNVKTKQCRLLKGIHNSRRKFNILNNFVMHHKILSDDQKVNYRTHFAPEMEDLLWHSCRPAPPIFSTC